MKLRYLTGSLLAAASLGVSLTVTQTQTPVQAKAKSSLKAIPKSVRGTWYHYEEHNGYYYQTMKLSAKKMTVYKGFDAYGRKHAKSKYTLHTLKNVNNALSYSSKKKAHWIFATNKKKGVEIGPWNFGFNFVGNGVYKVTHQTYKGKKVKVLTNRNGEVKDHFYQTKAQAKHFNPVGALHK